MVGAKIKDQQGLREREREREFGGLYGRYGVQPKIRMMDRGIEREV